MRALTERGHAVASQPTGMAGLRHAIDERPDLVVLDLGLPDLDGASLLRMLRSVSAVPVIVATARDDDRAVVAALDAGADDYVVKPFSADQLDARIRAVLRRTSTPDGAGHPIHRRRPRRRRALADGGAGRHASSICGRGSSTCWPIWSRARARSSRSARCWPRCGSRPTAAPTRRSTCTCPGCAASWVRPPPSRDCCTACAASASSWSSPADAWSAGAARGSDDVGRAARLPAAPRGADLAGRDQQRRHGRDAGEPVAGEHGHRQAPPAAIDARSAWIATQSGYPVNVCA